MTLFSRSHSRWRPGLQRNLRPEPDSGVCAACRHYHRPSISGTCSEVVAVDPVDGAFTHCLCTDIRRLTVDEADALGVGWP